ncbi:hypothetical protein VIGAN_08195000 [Vigna angularis var. angularis]|uniref:Uncharacterized protein n=1 Tax=Vigna angularis var. angularis TaxID=157739 RepID=A0A0S3SR02_PHAAN|nr:hypothetical protein VIGAN_08195000 [Vigna angularis var. angularis]
MTSARLRSFVGTSVLPLLRSKTATQGGVYFFHTRTVTSAKTGRYQSADGSLRSYQLPRQALAFLPPSFSFLLLFSRLYNGLCVWMLFGDDEDRLIRTRMIVELWRVMHSWWPLLLCKAVANGFHPTTLTRLIRSAPWSILEASKTRTSCYSSPHGSILST